MRHHILQELNFRVRRSGGELHGAAEVTPFAHVPGTAHLRTSILASWADMLALRYMQPVRIGPAVATATMTGGLGQAELRDSGNGDRLAVAATARTFGG